jgi:hypothetical protein
MLSGLGKEGRGEKLFGVRSPRAKSSFVGFCRKLALNLD